MSSFLKSPMVSSNRWKYIIGIIGFVLILVLIIVTRDSSCLPERFKEHKVTIPDGTVLKTSLSDTMIERSKGLSICDTLSDSQAMLFVFNRSDTHSFWMKGMHFPIDIFWLDEHKQIVFIHENAQPKEYQQGISYTPDLPARYVLETVAGFAKEHQMSIGNQLAW